MAIPAGWRAHRRASDGELVGSLAPSSEADGVATPVGPIGVPLGPARTAADAAELLERDGLASLARRWWCRLPAPLPASGCAPAAGEPDRGWRAVAVVEARPSGCTVRPEFPEPDERTRAVALPVPVGDLLVSDSPG